VFEHPRRPVVGLHDLENRKDVGVAQVTDPTRHLPFAVGPRPQDSGGDRSKAWAGRELSQAEALSQGMHERLWVVEPVISFAHVDCGLLGQLLPPLRKGRAIGSNPPMIRKWVHDRWHALVRLVSTERGGRRVDAGGYPVGTGASLPEDQAVLAIHVDLIGIDTAVLNWTGVAF